jgi:hypothetical protein
MNWQQHVLVRHHNLQNCCNIIKDTICAKDLFYLYVAKKTIEMQNSLTLKMSPPPPFPPPLQSEEMGHKTP